LPTAVKCVRDVVVLVTHAKDGVIVSCTEGLGKELGGHAVEARPI